MNTLMILAAALGVAGLPSSEEDQGARTRQPTVVLVHGAFADSSSWDPVTQRLLADGYSVVAVANPLRGVARDASYLKSVLASINGPVVLVGHSYGGAVISAAAVDAPNVRSLVYVAGYALEPGESPAKLAVRFPEGTLGQALAPPISLAEGGQDLYILPAKFWKQFAADLPEAQAATMAVGQRPVVASALEEPATLAAWQRLPSFFIYGELDRNIPRSAQAFMAQRARSRETIEVRGASHVVMISHPAAVADMIKRAGATP